MIVAPIIGFCVCSMFCCTLLCVLSGLAIILMRKRVLVALLCLSPGVLLLFLTVPWVGLQCVILVFSDHTHLLLSYSSILLRFSKRVGYGLSRNS